MIINKSSKVIRLLTGFLMAGVMLVSASAVTGTAHAARSLCRTDPIITFNDGTVVQLVADIQSDAALIDSVNYVLHVPTNMSLTSVVYAESDPVLETVNVVSDQAVGSYSGTADVDMAPGASKTNFTITATFNGVTTVTIPGDTSKLASLSFKVPAPAPAPAPKGKK